jgi:hypothetical protein
VSFSPTWWLNIEAVGSKKERKKIGYLAYKQNGMAKRTNESKRRKVRKEKEKRDLWDAPRLSTDTGT